MIFYPLTKDRWKDFETLFGPKGAYSGCWCMWWRIKRTEFEKQKGEGNRLAMKRIVDSDRIPGIIGYQDGIPAGWCAIAPRSEYESLNRSRVLKPVDDEKVWSIVCFFVKPVYRRMGILEQLIKAAICHVKDQKGNIVEAYPSIPKSGNVHPLSAFMGFPDVFEKLGFKTISNPSSAKCIMRMSVNS